MLPRDSKESLGANYQQPAAREHGKTLLEMVITLSIIGVVASIAMPTYQPIQQSQLSFAAEDVANAARYAREQARLFASPHGLEYDNATESFRVFRLETDSGPAEKVFDVIHPVSKQDYLIDISGDRFSSVNVTDFNGVTPTACTDSSLVFDAVGVVRCFNPSTARYESATITLALEMQSTTITIDGLNGRVTVQ